MWSHVMNSWDRTKRALAEMSEFSSESFWTRITHQFVIGMNLDEFLSLVESADNFLS